MPGGDHAMPVKARQVQTQRQRVRQRWLRDVEQNVHQVEKWAKDRKWAVRREQKLIEEPRLGAYYVPVASILAPAGQVQVEPVARYVAGGDGRIDLLAWPSLTRMMLIREGNRWV